MTENAIAYATEGHRHLPEIEQELRRARQRRRRSPSSRTCCRSTRALLASCYVDARRATLEADELASLYRDRYADEPFVEVVDGAAGPARRARHERSATSTSRSTSGGRVVVFAAIDNLWKGASGQACRTST